MLDLYDRGSTWTSRQLYRHSLQAFSASSIPVAVHASILTLQWHWCWFTAGWHSLLVTPVACFTPHAVSLLLTQPVGHPWCRVHILMGVGVGVGGDGWGGGGWGGGAVGGVWVVGWGEWCGVGWGGWGGRDSTRQHLHHLIYCLVHSPLKPLVQWLQRTSVPAHQRPTVCCQSRRERLLHALQPQHHQQRQRQHQAHWHPPCSPACA